MAKNIRTSALFVRSRYCIRKIFLTPRATYSSTEASRLLCLPHRKLLALVDSGEFPAERGDNVRFTWPQIAWIALRRWSPKAVEEELGRDAAGIFPPLLRTETVTLALPVYQTRMLLKLAEQDATDVSTIVFRLLDEKARADAEWLDAIHPGFAVAAAFPLQTRSSAAIATAPPKVSEREGLYSDERHQIGV